MQGLNIWQILWESGIVVKLVLLLLILSSVLSWTIVLQKYKQLKNLIESNDQFYTFFKNGHPLSEINREANENNDSSMSLMFKRGYEELNRISERLAASGKGSLVLHFSEHGFESLERALKTGYNQANEEMEQRGSTLASIGSITPFVVLFGTVSVIIDAFAGFSPAVRRIDAVASGI